MKSKEEKTFKTFVPITSKNPASVYVLYLFARVERRVLLLVKDRSGLKCNIFCLTEKSSFCITYYSAYRNGTNVFCFLSSLPLLLPATSAMFGSYLPAISLLLTNPVSPVWFCLIIRWERFCGTQKKTIVGILVFNPLWFTVSKIFNFTIKKLRARYFYIVRCGVQFIMKIITEFFTCSSSSSTP